MGESWPEGSGSPKEEIIECDIEGSEEPQKEMHEEAEGTDRKTVRKIGGPE